MILTQLNPKGSWFEPGHTEDVKPFMRDLEDESQFIIATHSPIPLAYPRSKILLLNENGITEVRYEDTEHYSATRYFLNNYPKMIDRLTGKE